MANKKRLARLRASLKKGGLKNALLSSGNDIFYYTGYRPSGRAFLLVNPRPVLFVSPLENSAEGLKGVDVIFLDKCGRLSGRLKKLSGVGYDEHDLTADAFMRLPRKGLKPAARHIKMPRMVKDREEIAKIRKACSLTKKVLRKLPTGKTEIDMARRINSDFFRLGDGCSFGTIVASGPNSWHVHHFPTTRTIKARDIVVVDAGARVDGYCSDCTRTFCKTPGKRERKLIEETKSIQAELASKAVPGIEFTDLQKLYEKMMKKAGHRVWHGIGHGVGLDTHDFLEGKLKPGMVITVEPGIYLKDIGGCRIEDTILIKKNGNETLT